jgi:biotin transport system substrate-specific component
MTTKTSLFSTYNLVLTGMFAAVLAVISQISIPMPTGVPITIQVFGIALTGVVLGWKLGLSATIAYILLGAVGLPIFSNFQGGVHVLTGMTGGYILGWPVMAVLCGIRPKTANPKINLLLCVVLAVAGLMVVEFTGALQWSFLANDMSLKAILVYSFVAFIPKDIVITILAVFIGKRIQKSLSRYLA